jgi:phosphate transport system permease protein
VSREGTLDGGTETATWNSSRVIANHKARKRRDAAIKVLAVCCLIAILVPLADLLYMFAYRGLEVISVARLVHNSAAFDPGLSNSIEGTALITGLSSLFAVPIGIFGGVYMAEFNKGGKFSEGLRFAADVLAGVPSIVLGYVGYAIFVIYFGWGFSALAAGIILSIIMFPYIFRTTEIALRKVPENIREGAVALGSTKTIVVNRLLLRFAMPAIMTGVLLSVGIALSETAPILYTASFASYNPTGLLHSPLGYLTGLIWFFYQSPLPADVNLAYLATFLLILIVLVLNVVARVGLSRFSKV